ncbi:MAG: fatty acid desaturase [Ectothiorhodospiraceae bacterium]|nr:fatty acid desaturase [Ectothiorhodospiraceae bacterium]
MRVVPWRLNALLALALMVVVLVSLVLASRTEGITRLAVAVACSFALLTVYALLHEGAHGLLHPNRRVNDAMGAVLGWLFPTAFSLYATTHEVHHRCNRTDHEMFDCYYPGESRLVRAVQWYGILTGLWWWLIPPGTVVLAIAPHWLRGGPWRRARTTAVLFDDISGATARAIRLEVVLGIVFWTTAFHVLALDLAAVAIVYACFAFNWSTRQYVTHAFTPRDVRDGAMNLGVSRPMAWVLLNGHWDRVHHRHPGLPWTALPAAAAGDRIDLPYWRQYLRLWRGPRRCEAPGPAPLSRAAYEALG